MESTQVLRYSLAMKWLHRAIERTKALDLQEGDLAEMASTAEKSVDASRISKWKKGEGRPYLDQVMGIAKGLGVSLDYLLVDDMPWLDDAEKAGVGPEVGRETFAIMKVVRAMGLSTEEAIRRLAQPEPTPGEQRQGVRHIATRRLSRPGGNPSGAEPVDPPPDPTGRVKRRR